jgi:hypothetical protein
MQNLPFWWVCREGDAKACQMTSRVFPPKHGFGCLFKEKEVRWKAVQELTLIEDVDLTASLVSAREEKLQQCFTMVSRQFKPPNRLNQTMKTLQQQRTSGQRSCKSCKPRVVLESFELQRSLSFSVDNIKLLERLDQKREAFHPFLGKSCRRKQLDQRTNHWCFHSTELELWDSFRVVPGPRGSLACQNVTFFVSHKNFSLTSQI